MTILSIVTCLSVYNGIDRLVPLDSMVTNDSTDVTIDAIDHILIVHDTYQYEIRLYINICIVLLIYRMHMV